MIKNIAQQLIKTHYLLHPVLLGLFFVLYGYNEMYESVELSELLYSLGIFVLLPLLVVIFISLYTQQPTRNGVYFTLLLAISFFSLSIAFFLRQVLPFPAIVRQGFIAPSLLFALGLFIYKSRHSSLQRLHIYFNIITMIYCFIELFLAFWNTLQHQKSLTTFQQNTATTTCTTCPDIYLVVLDAYANSNYLKKYWNFDNQYFIDSLQKKGYYSIRHARSNYTKTIYSIATLLNQDFVTPKTEDFASTRRQEIKAYSWIRHNKTVNTLLQHGYQAFNLSFFKMQGATMLLPSKSNYTMSFLHIYLVHKTVFLYLFKWLSKYNRQNNLSLRVTQPLQELKRLHKQAHTQPQFIYTHLLLPHYPYEFNRHGQTHNALAHTKTEMELYQEQLQYTNTLMLDLANYLEQNASRPFIVLITGDHGARILPQQYSESTLEKHHTTTLFKFPDQNYTLLYDTLSTVNLFQPILHKAIQQKISYLPDTLVKN